MHLEQLLGARTFASAAVPPPPLAAAVTVPGRARRGR
jgi:hypothetical protein